MKPSPNWSVRIAVISVALAFLYYIVPAVFIRVNLGFGPVSEELKTIIANAALDMDGGNFRNGSGVPGPKMSPAAEKLTEADIAQYRRDGYILVRNAIPPEHFAALKAMFTHIQDKPNIIQALTDRVTCATNVFGPDRQIKEFADLLYRLNLHWVAQKLLQANTLVMINSIIHYNLGSCKKEGSILSTHADFFSGPFTIERDTTKPDGFFGDNGIIAWIAVDEISDQAVTMQLGKGSHLHYTKAYPDHKEYHQKHYCPVFHGDLAKEDRNDTEFLDSFVQLPVMNPGDAVFFNGMSYHRPIPSCKREGGCTHTNSRRVTLRYVDGDRTSYRSDIPSKSRHYATRWCPPYLFQLLGMPCRATAGTPLMKGAPLPVVIDKEKKWGGRRIPGDGMSMSYLEPDPFPYFIGLAPLIHHDTCGLENLYVEKAVRRLMHHYVPSVQRAIWGEAPKPRPGEQLIYGV